MEIRFAPQLSTERGLSQMEVTEAVAAGVKRGMAAYPGIKDRSSALLYEGH